MSDSCRHGTFPDAPRPGLILLDINLPRLNGLEVLRRLQADPVRQSIPVVMLTTSASRREIEESYRLGANSYIVKPADFVHFTRVLQALTYHWLVLNRLPME